MGQFYIILPLLFFCKYKLYAPDKHLGHLQPPFGSCYALIAELNVLTTRPYFSFQGSENPRFKNYILTLSPPF